jgi:DNA-binding transcriptional regulator LsrR (DeoR family)
MPRLNIYVPSELHEQIERVGDAINLSRICSDALRDALNVRGDVRDVSHLMAMFSMGHSVLEDQVARRYGLRTVIARPTRGASGDSQDLVSHWAAAMVDRLVSHEMQLGIGGGSQMWDVVRRLKPRAVQLTV